MISTGALTASLMAHLRSRQPAPLVVSEIALAGSWGNQGRLDVVAVHFGARRALGIDGFEVKVSRGDFTQDVDRRKWEKYLPAVDRLSYAVPSGLVRKEEVPPGIGLVVFREDGASWSTVKRPDYRRREESGQTERILRRCRDDLFAQARQIEQRDRAARLLRMFDHAADLHRLEGMAGYWLNEAARRAIGGAARREEQAAVLVERATVRAQQIVENAERAAERTRALQPLWSLVAEVISLADPHAPGDLDAESVVEVQAALRAARMSTRRRRAEAVGAHPDDLR